MSKYCQRVNELLTEIKIGDKSRMTDLLLLTYNHLKVISRLYVFDKNNCEDALNEAYCRAYEYIQSFDPTKDGYNWLCRIVERVAININRANMAFVNNEEIDYERVAIFDDIERIHNRDMLARAIAKFTKQDRKILYYRFSWEMSYSQIGAKLNCTKSYAHKRATILIKRLRSMLSEYQNS